jgi:hypothetical protein
MRSRILVCVVALALVESTSRISAQTRGSVDSPLLTLRGIVSLCDGREATSIATCASYITGFAQGSDATQTAAVVEAVAQGLVRGAVPPTHEAIDAAVAKRYDELKLFCITSSWTAGYVQAHVVQYGREHPDLMGEPSGDQMLKILAKAFPCVNRK